MISPYVRRRRLAAELIGLRERHGYSAERLAKAADLGRQSVSRLENGHVRPDLDQIMRILAVFDVQADEWDRVVTIAREAQERGWWEKFANEMGPRQALYANLEAGAIHIREYQMTLLPGLLQIPTYTEARVRASRDVHPRRFDPSRSLEARVARQRVLDRPGGPTYEVVLDELAIRRLAAPPDIVATQLDHLIDTGHYRQKITIRILRLDTRIEGYAVPRSAFSIYQYPDDPEVVAVDTVTSDLVLIDPAEVRLYLTLYHRLRDAALPPSDSLDFLATVAEDVTNQEGDQRDHSQPRQVHRLAKVQPQ
jgi:transcriptional regulator with XRE-family HTH domain